MITSADLSSRSRQDLANLARDSGIAGYRGMSKDDLVAALRVKKNSLKKTTVSAKPISVVAEPSKPTKSVAPSKKPASKAAPKAKSAPKTKSSKEPIAVSASKQPASQAKAKSHSAKPEVTAKAATRNATAATKVNVASKTVAGGKASNGSKADVATTSPTAGKRPALTRSVHALTATKATPAEKRGTEPASKKNKTASVTLEPAGANKKSVIAMAVSTPKATATLKQPVVAKTVAPKAVAVPVAKPPVLKVLTSPGSVKLMDDDEDVDQEAAKQDVVAAKPRVPNRTFLPTAKKVVPPPVPATPPISAKSARIRREMAQRSQRALQNKDISSDVLVAGSAVRNGNGAGTHAPHKDRVVLLVRDSYWLQADWEITRAAVERIRVAMAEKWHSALPVLRLMAVADASANRSEQIVRDIPIHGGITSWYIDVDEPPSRYRVVVGYVADNERFFPICRSNVIETPRPGSGNRIDEHWRDIAEDYERIYSLSGGFDSNGDNDLKEVFEERLQRSMPTRGDSFGSGSDTDAALDRHRALPFEVDAELIIYGSTVPGATVMLGGEPVKLRPDGSFTIRLALPDKRQVFPVIAQSRDGMRQRTTVVAVERNTKVMEAVDRDANF